MEYDFHLLPSGIINPNVTAFIGKCFGLIKADNYLWSVIVFLATLVHLGMKHELN